MSRVLYSLSASSIQVARLRSRWEPKWNFSRSTFPAHSKFSPASLAINVVDSSSHFTRRCLKPPDYESIFGSSIFPTLFAESFEGCTFRLRPWTMPSLFTVSTEPFLMFCSI